MDLVDLLRFYLGDPETIRSLAANPWTLAVGAPLVLTAGLARHYDKHDLVRQSWRLMVPFVASTIAAAFLFLVLVGITRIGQVVFPLGTGILGLFWLTAPLAWLYGFPFERILAPPQASRARRCALGVVACLRVAIMAQCIAALLQCSLWESQLIVAGFAIPMALLALSAALVFIQRPESGRVERPISDESAIARSAGRVIDEMSGVVIEADGSPPFVVAPTFPRTPHPPIDTSSLGIALGCFSLVLLALCSWILNKSLTGANGWHSEILVASGQPPSASVWIVLAVSLSFWLACLVVRQPAQRRRTAAVASLRYASLSDAIAELGSRWPDDYPPQWKPAEALAQSGLKSRLLKAATIAAALPTGNWIRTGFLKELADTVPQWTDSTQAWIQNDQMPKEQLRDLIGLRGFLRDLPEGRDILLPYQDYLADLCDFTEERDPARFEVLQGLLAVVQKRGSRR